MKLTNSKKKWFVLYTKPNHELKVNFNLLKIGIESYCPVIISNRIWSDRIKKYKKAIINSIVFVKCKDSDRNKVFDIPSTLNYLFFCNEPAVVLDKEIDQLKKLENKKYIINDNLSKGDEIYLNKINHKGIVEKKTNSKTWINLEKINIRICI